MLAYMVLNPFRKVDPGKLEFANEWFLRGQGHLLKNIQRRKAPSHPQSSHQDFDYCVEVGQFGLDSEIDRLMRDKQVLMVELVKLRQEQQNTKAHLKAMEHRLKGTEMKQQQAMGFLARIIQNPSFVQQLVQHDRRKELVEAISNKRRKAIDQGAEVREFSQGGEEENYVKLEPQDKGFWEDLLNDGIEEDTGFFGVETEGEEEEEEVDMLVEKLGFMDSN